MAAEEPQEATPEGAVVQGGPPIGFPEIVLLTPQMVNVVKNETPAGTAWKLEFLITPFKVVAVQFDDDARAGIVKELTGGIQIAQPGDIAKL